MNLYTGYMLHRLQIRCENTCCLEYLFEIGSFFNGDLPGTLINFDTCLFSFAGVHVAVSMGGSMSASLLEREYLPNMWKARSGHMFKQKAVLSWDSHPSHKDATVVNLLRHRYHTNVLLIPPGMTPLLQPLDVVINKVSSSQSFFMFNNE